jgi:magnesium chelatase subunit D
MVARLFAVDPSGLGGVAVVSGPGPVRDVWLDGVRRLLPEGAPVKRLPAGIEDERLLGGIDLIATLGAGRPILQMGVLAEANGGIVIIPMAERLSPGLAARIASVLDRRELAIERDGLASRVPARLGIIAFDEGATPDERLPTALRDRLAFHLDFQDLSARGLDCLSFDRSEIARGRAGLTSVKPAPDEIVEALAATAEAYGIESVMAPLWALRAARVAAALAGRVVIAAEDAALAARLVLAPRARIAPTEDETGDAENQEDPAEDRPTESVTDEDAEPAPQSATPNLEDVILAAVQAALPDGLLTTVRAGGAAERGPSSLRQGAGAPKKSPLRGRPAGARMGAMRAGSRLALVDTLRAAAPWQTLRGAKTPDTSQPRRIEIRRGDFRIKKFVQRRESSIVFAVDASGSTAFHRLAETKGAVELLLGDAYVARTHAALIAFRGKGADLLLPPTRSLSRAKSLLADLPGGGGTPLAAGIDAAVLTALSERAKGRDPLIVILTDGRANIGSDGLPGRSRALDDALAAARRLGVQRISAIFVDTSPRPRGEAADLAGAMGARYVALPYIEAAAVRDVVLGAGPVRRR